MMGSMWRRLARQTYNLAVAVTFFLCPVALLASVIWGGGPTPEWLLMWALALALFIFGRRFCLWLGREEEGEVYFLTSVPTSDIGLRTGPEPKPQDAAPPGSSAKKKKGSGKKGKQP